MSAFWNSTLDFLSKIVTPDWGQLIGLMPLAVAGVALLFVLLLGALWTWQMLRHPRTRLEAIEGPRPAPLDADGRPAFPPGEPYCRTDALIYEPGATRCERCGNELGVSCPMCGVGRPAHFDTCGNCGLVLRIARHERLARPAGPPPGGAAIA